MGLVSRMTEQVEVPGEGMRVTIRPLAAGELMEADLRQTQRSAELAKAFPQEWVRQAEGQRAEPMAEDDPRRYDLETVLRYGIVSWDYQEPCDDEHKRLLDAPTAQFLAREILKRSVRPAGEGTSSVGSPAPALSTDGSATPGL